MKSMFTRVAVASAISITGLVIAGTSSVSAKDGDVMVRRPCSEASTAKLKLRPRDGGIEYQFEVDSNVNGQRWRVHVKDNGTVILRGVRTTRPPSGSFTVERRTANRAGTDTLVASAKNPSTGELCRVRAVL